MRPTQRVHATAQFFERINRLNFSEIHQEKKEKKIKILKKRERTQINKIRNEKEIASDTTEN